MRLAKAHIEGYRSIRDTMEFVVDPRVTVVLGANDHGKTNLIEAFLHLNDSQSFEADHLNWDRGDDSVTLPYVRFEFLLDEPDKTDLARLNAAHTALEANSEFSTAAQSALNDARKGLSAAERSLSAAEDALTTADEHLQERRDAGAPPTETKAASAAVTKAKKTRASAASDRDSAQSAVDDIDVSLLLALAEEVKLRAQLDGKESGEALDAALKAASRRSSQAGIQVKAANRALTEASEAHSVAASQGQPQEELDRLASDRDAADRTLQQATREKNSAREAHARLKRAAELAERADSGDERLGLLRPPSASTGEAEVTEFSIERRGVGTERAIVPIDGVSADALASLVASRVPLVQIIHPFDRIPDAVTRKQLSSDDDFLFMRGIFHYAGLTPDEWDGVFEQSDRTTRRLEDASEHLNDTLKKSWSQGSKLQFRLDHDSAKKTIELQIKDPAVTDTFVRASRRSSGFTHFFALKTILHALQCESPSASYIWLFDEPGIYLHPDGQYDLIKVMETLAQTNQVIYTTHSIFMANKNYPVRHRLLYKGPGGTQVDGKPFRSRWKPALDNLGLSLTGSLLFASRVLLVEGDSDAILINAVLHKLLEAGLFEHDVNSLAVMGTGDARDTQALVRILQESGETAPTLALLFDSDEGGKARLATIAPLVRDRKIPHIELEPVATAIEDHLVLADILFPRAVAEYLAQIAPSKTPDDYETDLNASLQACLAGDAAPKGLASWSRDEGKAAAALDGAPSPVGLARHYAQLLDEVDAATIAPEEFERARLLCERIAHELDLPPLLLEDEPILSAAS